MVEHEHSHLPVLLSEAIEALAPRADGIYVDGTFGRGGHTRALLARLGPDARVIAIDRDPSAIAAAAVLARSDARLEAVRAPFSRLAEVLEARDLVSRVDGVLLDLGVSSPQLDDAERGFGFQSPYLDMRMDPEQGQGAAAWLAEADEAEIARVLHELGEERFSRRIARAIVARRAQAPIESGAELSALVAGVVPSRERGKHPATRTFQALRLQVNAELDELRTALGAALEVKQFMHDRPERTMPRHLPVEQVLPPARLRPLGKPRRPSAAEVSANPRARSALLRVAEKLA